MTGEPGPDLAELLADRAGTVVLTQAWSPTDQPSTPSPSAATVPEHSIPRTSEAPGGGG